ncbi:hypothetical protein BH23GEM6_BH23GEM6_07600 [soil metagenome]
MTVGFAPPPAIIHVQTSSDLRQLLISLDGKGYRSYKQMESGYQFEGFQLLRPLLPGTRRCSRT